MKNIYLDNAATTPIDERVFNAMLPYLKDHYGNPSSIHREGRLMKVMIEEAREAVADFIGAKPAEIIFTSGGTEANNTIIKGIAFSQDEKRNHIIASSIEHSSILDTISFLNQRFGFEITLLSVNKYGEIDINELSKMINDNTCLICVMHSNNELGIINDINKIRDLIGGRNIHLHTDSVQSIGKTEFDVQDIACDSASLSAHKFYGPKGIGALFTRKTIRFEQLIHGGKQERNRRGGTENIGGIAGLKKAIELLQNEMDKDISHYTHLKNKLLSLLNSDFKDKVILNSKTESNSLPNIVSLSISPDHFKADADTLIIKMDTNGISISSGSACASGSVQPSHVLKSIGYNDELARFSMRISFGRLNNENDIEEFIKVLKQITN